MHGGSGIPFHCGPGCCVRPNAAAAAATALAARPLAPLLLLLRSLLPCIQSFCCLHSCPSQLDAVLRGVPGKQSLWQRASAEAHGRHSKAREDVREGEFELTKAAQKVASAAKYVADAKRTFHAWEVQQATDVERLEAELKTCREEAEAEHDCTTAAEEDGEKLEARHAEASTQHEECKGQLETASKIELTPEVAAAYKVDEEAGAVELRMKRDLIEQRGALEALRRSTWCRERPFSSSWASWAEFEAADAVISAPSEGTNGSAAAMCGVAFGAAEAKVNELIIARQRATSMVARAEGMREEAEKVEAGGDCPCCGRAVTDHDVQQLGSKRQQQVADAKAALTRLEYEADVQCFLLRRGRLGPLEAKVMELEAECNRLRAAKSATSAKLDTARARAHDVAQALRAKEETLQRAKEATSHELSKWRQEQSARQANAKVAEVKLSEAQKRLGDKQAQLNPHIEMVRQGEQDEYDALLKQQKAKDEHKGHETEEQHMKQLRHAFQDGVPAMLRDHMLQDLERRAKAYIDQLSGAIRLKLEMAVGEKMVRAVSVKGDDGIWRDRALRLLSAGEWWRVSLGFALAYAEFVRERLELSCNLLVLDEAFQHLDAEGVQAVIATLKALDDHETVLVLDHSTISDEMASCFDFKVEVVERRDGTSRVPQANLALCYGGAVSPLRSSPAPMCLLTEDSGGGGGASSYEALGAYGNVTPPPPPQSTPSRQPTPPPTSRGGSPLRGISSPVPGAPGPAGPGGLLLADDSEPINAEFLASLGIEERHLRVFENGEIKDVRTLKMLTVDDVKELGLPLGPRRQLLNALGL